MNQEDYIEDVLTYIECGEVKQKSAAAHKVSLDHFNRALLCVPGVNGLKFGRLTEGVTLDDLPAALDVSFMTKNDSAQGTKFQLQRVREVPIKQLRGRATRLARRNVEIAVAVMASDGIYRSFRAFYGWTGARWVRLVRSHEPLETWEETILCTGPAFQMSGRWHWQAFIGASAKRTVAIETDAVGARAIFKLRDLPPGKQRRSALRHWVTEHMRKSRIDAAEEVKVREHLRGETKFAWNGLHVELRPSELEMDEARGEGVLEWEDRFFERNGLYAE